MVHWEVVKLRNWMEMVKGNNFPIGKRERKEIQSTETNLPDWRQNRNEAGEVTIINKIIITDSEHSIISKWIFFFFNT